MKKFILLPLVLLSLNVFSETTNPQWEIVVPEKNYEITYRLPVYGGWIVKNMNYTKGMIATVFVSDPKHEWVIQSAQLQ